LDNRALTGARLRARGQGPHPDNPVEGPARPPPAATRIHSVVDLRELHSVRDVRSASGDDALLLWAAGDLAGNQRAFCFGAATAVAAPDLSRRDRLAIAGPADDASVLVQLILPWIGTTFRPIGDESLMRDLVIRVAELEFVGAFGWMQTATASGRRAGSAWLSGSDRADIAALLDEAFPDSYAHPDQPGVRRWAGARDETGALLACAADAWSAPQVGFLAGVTTAKKARGRGVATAVCGFVVDELVAEHGLAALVVDSWNTAAVRLYRNLGLSWRSIAAARFTDC
jgi:ribosomal protein S18 acetylase RimI-like enzyme